MTASELEPPPRRTRTQSRDARRTQLIEATIATIAERGYSRTTLTDVSRRAGLSHGLVLFYFETKDRLLAETLDYLSEEYRANWQAALAAAGPEPEQRLAALIEADFRPEVCRPGRLSAWCAYWGESQSRPLYQARCGANDEHYNRILEAICAGMNERHGYGAAPVRAARLIRITIEGTWLELMTLANPYDQQEALLTVWTCAHGLYPRHFTPDGPRASSQQGAGPQG